MVTLTNEMLFLSICIYGILQIHCNEVPAMRVCFHGLTFEEVCHKTNRRYAEDRDLLNSTTTTTETTSTTSSTEPIPTTSSMAPALADVTSVTINFKFKCLESKTNDCEGQFEITFPFQFLLSGGNSYIYLCNDILKVFPGANAYAYGLRLSTLVRRFILNPSLPAFTPEEVTQKWISCPKIRTIPEDIVLNHPFPLPPQLLHYTCWSFNNTDELSLNFLNRFDLKRGECYDNPNYKCHVLLYSDAFGTIIKPIV